MHILHTRNVNFTHLGADGRTLVAVSIVGYFPLQSRKRIRFISICSTHPSTKKSGSTRGHLFMPGDRFCIISSQSLWNNLCTVHTQGFRRGGIDGC